MSSRKVREEPPLTEDAQQQLFDELLKSPLLELDQWQEPPPPSQAAFKQLVLERRRLQKERLWRELLIFWSVAAVVLSVVVLLWVKAPALFVVVQGIVLLGAGGIVVWQARKQVRTWRE